ncbi:phosphate ABC transporter substrate-binding protein PstS [Micromonosporaceae bacterium Da 78-11]
MRLRTLTLLLLLTVTGCTTPPAAVADPVSCSAGAITAQGSSAQANALSAWIREYQIACPDATIAYTSTGSGAGIKAFLNGTGDFAGTDSPLTAADRSRAAARCRTVHLPLVVGPIALAYNVVGAADLRLSPPTVAKIFAGAVTTWNDPVIAADNPGDVLPATRIATVHRSDSSGTTANFTAFLAATAGPDWRLGSAADWPAPGGLARQGSNGIAETIAGTDGAIGYVEASYARFHELPTARVGNGAGQFVELTDAAAGLTVDSAEVAGPDLRLTLDYRTRTAGAYPIVLVTYEIVCATGASPVVKSFLTYAVSPAGQAALTRLGYAPLPDALRRKVATAVATL